MRNTRWLTKLAVCAIVVPMLAGPVAFAAPPGPIDGRSIPADFGPDTLLATQQNKTGFGDQTVTPGGFTNGSELDLLYVAKTADALKLGIAGNLNPPNHVHIFVGSTGDPGLGHQELKAQGVDGPPFTIQNMSQIASLNTNGTPGVPEDDFCEITSNGTILPMIADYGISLDTFGGNLSVSEYTLFASSIGFYDCGGAASPLFASRVFVTQTAVSDTDGIADNDQGFGYQEIGIDNTNVAGVTDTDGTTALSATTGIEMTIPFTRLGVDGDEVITVLVTLTGDAGFVSAQMLPAHPSCTTEGDRPDLSGLGNTLSINLATLDLWTGGPNDSDGIIDPSHYGGSEAAVQTCPTDFGDQQVDPNAVTLTGGSELNQMLATNDDEFLYLGLTGNLEANGNGLMVFVASAEGGQGSTATPLDVPNGASRVVGMTGSRLPKKTDGSDVLYDYAYEINGSVPAGEPAASATYFVDFTDINGDSSKYLGSNDVNSTGLEFDPSPDNPNGFVVAYNFLNEDGVIGCGGGDPCDLETNEEMAARAVTAAFGFEFAIPLVDIGITELPAEVCLFTFVTNDNGTYGSNQGLPTLRDPDGAIPPNSVENAGASPQSPAIDFSNDGAVGFCSLFPPSDPDCQFAYFARAACVTLQPSCASTAACPNADVNCDDIADGFDIAVIRQGVNWLMDTEDAAAPRADVNGDGVVDGFDIAAVRIPLCWLQ